MDFRVYEHLKIYDQDSSEGNSQHDFCVVKDWYEKFKQRWFLHNIRIHGELASADVDIAKKYPKEFIEDDQEFNMDESGLN